MPKNEFICKFGVYNIGFNGHKNPQVNAAYHDYAHLIPIKLLFHLKKFHSVEFSLFEKKFSITGIIFSHIRSEQFWEQHTRVTLLSSDIS